MQPTQKHQRLVVTENENNTLPQAIKSADTDNVSINYVNTCVVSPLIVQMNRDDEESDVDETLPIKTVKELVSKKIPKERNLVKSRLKPIIQQNSNGSKKKEVVVSIKKTGKPSFIIGRTIRF
jgi:hypothetical protein